MKFTVVIFALVAGLSKAIRISHSEAHSKAHSESHLSSTNQIAKQGHHIKLDENIKAQVHKLLKLRSENHECEEIITDQYGNKYRVVLTPVINK